MQTLLMPILSLTLRQELWFWSIYLKLFVDNNVELERQKLLDDEVEEEDNKERWGKKNRTFGDVVLLHILFLLLRGQFHSLFPT